MNKFHIIYYKGWKVLNMNGEDNNTDEFQAEGMNEQEYDSDFISKKLSDLSDYIEHEPMELQDDHTIKSENSIYEDIQIDLSNLYTLDQQEQVKMGFQEMETKLADDLKQLVHEELDEKSDNETTKKTKNDSKSNLKKTFVIVMAVLGVILLATIWTVGTKSGRKVLYRLAGGYIHGAVDNEVEESFADNIAKIPGEETEVDPLAGNDIIDQPVEMIMPSPRQEEYVTNILLFGLEEFDNAKNTDSIMMVSINSLDKTIKLTSILRDIFIETDTLTPRKLNSIYGSQGATGLVKVIEDKFLIKIDGYAYINFQAFESIVDYLGGISIELGEEEAHYLNTTNYISNKTNRNITPGWFTMNGNQALGYCRIRKVVTIGGANDDYGRTLRQRRVLEAIFNRYKSKNIFDLIKITNYCLEHVKTNLTSKQIENLLETVVENKITQIKTTRIPANNTFEALDYYNGVDDPLVIDFYENTVDLYEFIYLDSEADAKIKLEPKPKNKE